MLSVNSLNNNYYVNFGNKKAVPKSLEQNMEILKNRIIAEERTINSYCPDVVGILEAKFSNLMPLILNLSPKRLTELNKNLQESLLSNDLTSSYIALGDLEKGISQI